MDAMENELKERFEYLSFVLSCAVSLEKQTKEIEAEIEGHLIAYLPNDCVPVWNAFEHIKCVLRSVERDVRDELNELRME